MIMCIFNGKEIDKIYIEDDFDSCGSDELEIPLVSFLAFVCCTILISFL